jgi:hypothetical protein
VPTRSFIVVSVQDRALQLWEKGAVTFRARAAVGMGEQVLDGDVFVFETPRGRYRVQEVEDEPVWVAPDWHYLELATKKKTDVVNLSATRPITLADGSRLEVQGTTVARCVGADCTAFAQSEEILADGKVVMPPIATIQRQYTGILGTHRLKLGDGYAIHGTNKPSSIGRASSHGCIRLRNQDIDFLYKRAPVGTPVFIY